MHYALRETNRRSTRDRSALHALQHFVKHVAFRQACRSWRHSSTGDSRAAIRETFPIRESLTRASSLHAGSPFDAIVDLSTSGTAANWAALATAGVYPEDPMLNVGQLATGNGGQSIPAADVTCEVLCGRPARSRRVEIQIADLPIFSALGIKTWL